MSLIQVTVLLGLAALTNADVSEIVGNNQYLPPSKGYNYDRPGVPFSPSPSRPSPTPSYRPPSYQPPTPSYSSPSSPSATYGTPTRVPTASPSYSPSNNIPSSVGGPSHDHGDHDHHEPGMPYDFEYKVKDDYYGTDYSRNEVSDGDVIRGEYRVQLPDGRLQIVKYTADWKNGFNADVSYQGEPTYPSGPGSSGAGSNNYPASSGPSNSYGPPPSANAPSSSYGPPNTGY